ncbi:hypothetical protein ABT120_46005 [Nonomuraea angiospora]|uniref:dihydrofolate reductase family protein n=1 Tax=Nonomuraea angiospora TaxID=46172 RepID=UPI00331D5C59
MAGPKGEMDWLSFPWTDDINAYIGALTDPVDCIVLGRRLAGGFIPAWAAGPEGEDQKSIDKMNDTPKVVISNTLTESPWENAVVAGGDLAEIVNGLKARPGGDMIAYAGSPRCTTNRSAPEPAAANGAGGFRAGPTDEVGKLLRGGPDVSLSVLGLHRDREHGAHSGTGHRQIRAAREDRQVAGTHSMTVCHGGMSCTAATRSSAAAASVR